MTGPSPRSQVRNGPPRPAPAAAAAVCGSAQFQTQHPPPGHLAGQIMWLRRRDRIAVETNLEEGCYDHPVVILSPKPRDGGVVMLMVSYISILLSCIHQFLQNITGDINRH